MNRCVCVCVCVVMRFLPIHAFLQCELIVSHQRVLKYSPPIVLGAFPDGVMAFANFSFLTDVRFDGAGNLYVADGIGNRMVFFFSLSLLSFPTNNAFIYHLSILLPQLFIPQEETGGAASFVYGQSNLSSGIQEQTSSASLSYPTSLAFASGLVVICSSAENRVLVFPPGPPASNDIAAIRVLGQPDFESHNRGSGALDRMYLPYGVMYDGVTNTLWVSDTYNNRILCFENFIVPVQNLAPLDVVITFLQGQQPTVFVYPKGFVAKDILTTPNSTKKKKNNRPHNDQHLSWTKTVAHPTSSHRRIGGQQQDGDICYHSSFA
jgi:hypothetical protein